MLKGTNRRGLIWTSCTMFVVSLISQAQPLPANLDLPNTTVTSGVAVDGATNSITADNGFVVNGSAAVTFTAGSRISLEPGFHATAGSAPVTFHANIATPSFPITITTAPSMGLSLTVDSTACTSPCTFQWLAGSSHTIGTNATQNPTSGTQYLFANWSDSGGLSHALNVTNSTYTANFTTQYFLTTSVTWPYLINHPEAEGTITPINGWYNGGTVIPITAAAASGFQFTGFAGDLAGSTPSQNLTMVGPMTVTAGFGTTSLSSNPTSGHGPTQFAVRLTTPNGDPPATADGISAQVLINWGEYGASGCYVMYVQQNNWLILADDSGGSWSGYQAPGTTGTISNSQCTLDFGASSVTNDGATLIVNVSLTFLPPFVGTRDVYTYDTFYDTPSGGWIGEWETAGTYLAYQGTVITFSPINATIDQNGGSGTTGFQTTGNWTATVSDPWIHITSASSGSGNATLAYSIDANNTQNLRNGFIAVNGSSFWIYQEVLIIYLNPTSVTLEATNSSSSFNVTVSPSGTYNASTNNPDWITVTSGGSGTNSGTVSYSVATNTGDPRTGSIQVNTNNFPIIQKGHPVITGYVATTSGASLPGVTITLSGSGVGSTTTDSNGHYLFRLLGGGAGTFTVTPSLGTNMFTPPSTTFINLVFNATASFAITQATTVTINPASATEPSSGGLGSLAVTVSPSGSWTATSQASWISITSGASGVNSGTVAYSVLSNTGPERSGFINVNGTIFAITQAGGLTSLDWATWQSCITIPNNYCPLDASANPYILSVGFDNHVRTLLPANGVTIAGTGASPSSTVLKRPAGIMGTLIYVAANTSVTITYLTVDGYRSSIPNSQTGCPPDLNNPMMLNLTVNVRSKWPYWLPGL